MSSALECLLWVHEYHTVCARARACMREKTAKERDPKRNRKRHRERLEIFQRISQRERQRGNPRMISERASLKEQL